jgi:hypothetical protein
MKNLEIKIESLKKDCLLARQIEYNEDKPILSSMTGGIFWGQKDESWPIFDSKPMIPILSILISELPFKIAQFNNIELITIFVDEEGAPIDEEEGSLVIRTYSDTEGLVPLEKPADLNKTCFRLEWDKALDFPNEYQLEQSLSSNEYELYLDPNSKLMDKYPNHSGIKIGGWPYLIQDVYFLKFDFPEYVFQFDSNEVFSFCDSGMGTFMNSKKIGWYSHWESM